MIFTSLDDVGVDKFVLDISQENDKTKYKMLLWQRNGGQNQRFRLLKNNQNGKYQILSGNWAVTSPNNVNAPQLQAKPVSNAPN